MTKSCKDHQKSKMTKMTLTKMTKYKKKADHWKKCVDIVVQ